MRRIEVVIFCSTRREGGHTSMLGGGSVRRTLYILLTYHRTVSYTTFDNRNANYGIDGGHPGLQLRPLDAVTGKILLFAPFRHGGRQGTNFIRIMKRRLMNFTTTRTLRYFTTPPFCCCFTTHITFSADHGGQRLQPIPLPVAR